MNRPESEFSELREFIKVADAAISKTDLNDEDFRLLAYKLGHDAISILQLGWLLKHQVDLTEEPGRYSFFGDGGGLRTLWDRGVKAGLFQPKKPDSLFDNYE